MNNIYDDKAFFDAYSRMARSTGGLEAAGEWHQLQPLFPAMEGSRVLDLGCGYGWHCKYAVEQGAAEALGLDLSEKMIAEARARNADPRIRYEVCGIAEYSYPAGYYDLVVSNLALHYLADLDDIYRKVFSTLRPGGVFLIQYRTPGLYCRCTGGLGPGHRGPSGLLAGGQLLLSRGTHHPLPGSGGQKTAPYPHPDPDGSNPVRLCTGGCGRGYARSVHAGSARYGG